MALDAKVVASFLMVWCGVVWYGLLRHVVLSLLLILLAAERVHFKLVGII